jgi:ATP-dependent Lhr-like helicase
LLALESEGFARGSYTPGATETEWCERRLLAHNRYTVKRQPEIEPVSAADFMRFLLDWQHTAPDGTHGRPGCGRRDRPNWRASKRGSVVGSGNPPTRVDMSRPGWMIFARAGGLDQADGPKLNPKRSQGPSPVRTPVTLITRKNCRCGQHW